MPETTLNAFQKFPDEAAIIGRLLAGYANLEMGLMSCAQVVRDDFDTVFKTMFRARGESQRITIGDALARRYYDELGIGTEYSMAISVMKYCLKIRNRYAHCVWYDDNSGMLAFVNLEEIAEEHDFIADLKGLTRFHVDLHTLQAQEAYFAHASRLLMWANYEGRFRGGKISNQPVAKPAQMIKPALHIP